MGQSYMHGDEQANRVGELISDAIYSARQSGIPIEKIIIGIVGELHGLTDELNQTIQMHNV